MCVSVCVHRSVRVQEGVWASPGMDMCVCVHQRERVFTHVCVCMQAHAALPVCVHSPQWHVGARL